MGDTHPRAHRRRPARWIVAVVVAGLLAVSAAVALESTVPRHARAGHRSEPQSPAKTSARSATVGPTTTTLPPPGPGFVPGPVTAVGDSVMLDYQNPLQFVLPEADIDAAVSRQWSDGESILSSLKSQGRLGAEVVVGLGTNGPITDADFDALMSILQGASRVVFVNIHVDRPWQDANNAVLAQGAARYPRVVVVDWASLAAQNPQWFGIDGTHLAINGPGAVALATLIATTLAKG